MAQAGADVIGAIVGVTSGGLTGAQELVSLEHAVKIVQEIMEAAQAVNSEIMFLTHGGPFKDVDTASYSVQNSLAHGYASGSSGERMPTENAVIEITRQYKEIRLK
jgi:predicted TIM-barrel enzyme